MMRNGWLHFGCLTIAWTPRNWRFGFGFMWDLWDEVDLCLGPLSFQLHRVHGRSNT